MLIWPRKRFYNQGTYFKRILDKGSSNSRSGGVTHICWKEFLKKSFAYEIPKGYWKKLVFPLLIQLIIPLSQNCPLFSPSLHFYFPIENLTLKSFTSQATWYILTYLGNNFREKHLYFETSWGYCKRLPHANK